MPCALCCLADPALDRVQKGSRVKEVGDEIGAGAVEEVPEAGEVRDALRLGDGLISAWMVAAMPAAAALARSVQPGLLLLVCAVAVKREQGDDRGQTFDGRSLSSVSGGAGIEERRYAFRTEDPVEQRTTMQVADSAQEEVRGLRCVGAEQGGRQVAEVGNVREPVEKSEAPTLADLGRGCSCLGEDRQVVMGRVRRPSGSLASASSIARPRSNTAGSAASCSSADGTEVRRSIAMTGSFS